MDKMPDADNMQTRTGMHSGCADAPFRCDSGHVALKEVFKDDFYMGSLSFTPGSSSRIRSVFCCFWRVGDTTPNWSIRARMMLKAGLYAKFGVPDYGLAFHTNATLPAGTIGIDSGYTMAAAESVDITVHGVGAHGAQPQASIDPIVLASMIVVELQTIVSRNVTPTDAVVVTVGAFQGGVKNNIIPDKVVLKLTVRTFTDDVREMVHKRIREIARGMALAAGLPEDLMPEISFLDAAPANYNDPEMVKRLRA